MWQLYKLHIRQIVKKDSKDLECFFFPYQVKVFLSLRAVAISLCHLQPLPLSTPVIGTNWPISHNPPSCLTQHPLHHRFTDWSEWLFLVTPAWTWPVADHPQLPAVSRQSSESKMRLLEYCLIAPKLCPQNIYKGIHNGIPNPSPPTLSAHV